MAALPDACADLVCTDPPFGIGFGPKTPNYRRQESRVLKGYREIPEADYAAFTQAWLAQAVRVTRDTGSLYVISGWNGLRDLLNAAHGLELALVNHIIWQYPFGVVTKNRFVTSHYHILYLCKNEKRRKFNTGARVPDLPPGWSPGPALPGMEGALSRASESLRSKARTEQGKSRYADLEDVWRIPREYWPGETKTPTKLPWALVAKILAYSSDPGDLVLDPFLGSGQVAVAAQAMDRRYLGWELAPEHFAFAEDRLRTGRYRRGAGPEES